MNLGLKLALYWWAFWSRILIALFKFFEDAAARATAAYDVAKYKLDIKDEVKSFLQDTFKKKP